MGPKYCPLLDGGKLMLALFPLSLGLQEQQEGGVPKRPAQLDAQGMLCSGTAWPRLGMRQRGSGASPSSLERRGERWKGDMGNCCREGRQDA